MAQNSVSALCPGFSTLTALLTWVNTLQSAAYKGWRKGDAARIGHGGQAEDPDRYYAILETAPGEGVD